MSIAGEVRFLRGVTFFVVFVFLCLVLINKSEKESDGIKITPLSEVRCSDLERAIDDCEASDDVALCRGRYDVKIAMCFRGQ